MEDLETGARGLVDTSDRRVRRAFDERVGATEEAFARAVVADVAAELGGGGACQAWVTCAPRADVWCVDSLDAVLGDGHGDPGQLG